MAGTSGDRQLAVALERHITTHERVAWGDGTPEQWATESFAIAASAIYPGVPRNGKIMNLDAAAADAGERIAAVQLEKAGVRLAALINRALP